MTALEALPPLPDAAQIQGVDDADEYVGHYKIDGPGSANWGLAKYAYYLRRMEENQQVYDEEVERLKQLFAEEIDRIKQWLQDANTPLERSAIYFQSILTNWHEEQLMEDEKRKTIPLPNGTLVSTKTPDKYDVEDEETFMANAPEELIRVKYEPNKKAIAKHVKDTGEIPAGVTVEKGERNYSIKVAL